MIPAAAIAGIILLILAIILSGGLDDIGENTNIFTMGAALGALIIYLYLKVL